MRLLGWDAAGPPRCGCGKWCRNNTAIHPGLEKGFAHGGKEARRIRWEGPAQDRRRGAITGSAVGAGERPGRRVRAGRLKAAHRIYSPGRGASRAHAP